MKTEEIMEKYLGERSPTPKDWNIKDLATALTGEIETLIENIVNDWQEHDEFDNIDLQSMAKVINLAIKNINRNKVVKNCME